MARRGGGWGRWTLLILAFLAVHIALSLIVVLDDDHAVYSDLQTYDYWVYRWQRGGPLVGVDIDWVYPVGALIPILAAASFGTDTGVFFSVWLLLVLVLDGVALVLLARRRMALAWWWLGFTALLGPVAVARLDSVALALVIPGVLVLQRHPAVASAVFTAAAWIKVWPAVLVLAMVTVLQRVRGVLIAAATVSVAVVAAATASGALGHLLSFAATQTGRGIQIEAPAALPWVWIGVSSGRRHPFPLDPALLTFQVAGPGVAEAVAVMSVLLPVGILGVLAVVLVARRRGAAAADLLPLAALALTTTVIALNKVGSPQYTSWLAAPVLLGLLWSPRRFRFPAVLVLVLAGTTQLVYPWLYFSLLPLGIALTIRNALEFVLLGWSVRELLRLARERRRSTFDVVVAAA